MSSKVEAEAKAKMQMKAKRREQFSKQGKSLAKFSTSGTYEPRGHVARKPSKLASLPDTNTSPKVIFKINGTEATHNLQEALQVELRKCEESQLMTVFDRMDVNKDGKVGAGDIDATLRSLGHTPGEDEVSSMLWEVDDDTKGHLTAEDFHTSYYRIRESTEQDEPRSWFRLVEFMMIDEDGDGTVEFDEAAKMFRNRYGKDAVARVQSMFAGRAESLGGTDGAVKFKAMSYADFLGSIKLLVPNS